jgi:hypothetical protein
MSYISEIFSRLDIQHIREFLLHGVECVRLNPKGYKERIDEAGKPVKSILQQYFPETGEYEKIMGSVLDYTSNIQDVYMEIGLQCGFALAMQIFQNTERNEG